jgi:hypothetical protein
MFEVIFSNFWTWSGSVVLVFTFGYSMSLPFFWYAKSIEQRRMLGQEDRLNRFFDQRN